MAQPGRPTRTRCPSSRSRFWKLTGSRSANALRSFASSDMNSVLAARTRSKTLNWTCWEISSWTTTTLLESTNVRASGINEWPYVLGVRSENKEEYFRDVVLPALDKQALIESIIEKNGHGLLFGDKTTWVVAAESFSRFIDFGAPDGLKKYPKIKALVKKVHGLPDIKEHIAERKPCIA
ncbi:hypothetical protein L596_015147 [Steinernema carpocapsae]|uniref:Glutathione S-transferase C-terminal domain-containing protein n=1 Tax=Steinernema carpocapsae TaxID=34508 RepID=A0A4U5NEZ9_STECR|nr:hypothetical protein L596_015147 [Steinernema carpocapsae]